MDKNNRLEILRSQLKSATKQKITNQRIAYQMRETEKILEEEINTMNYEMIFYREELQRVTQEMSQTRHQISMIDTCTSAEQSKISSHLQYLGEHQKKFNDLYEKDRKLIENRNKEAKAKLEVIEETTRLKKKQEEERNEQVATEVKAIEDECEAIERECVILKKRNNAIMLKLRRKLVETEEIRNKLTKHAN